MQIKTVKIWLKLYNFLFSVNIDQPSSENTFNGEIKIYTGNSEIMLLHFITAITTVAVVLVSVLIVSVISTAIITSIIVWCVMRRRRPSSNATATTDHDKEQVTELATVIYDTPNVIKAEHTITTQENVAYGGTIPLKENVAYGGTIPLKENVAYGGTIPLQHNEAYQQVNIN